MGKAAGCLRFLPQNIQDVVSIPNLPHGPEDEGGSPFALPGRKRLKNLPEATSDGSERLALLPSHYLVLEPGSCLSLF